MLDKDGEKGSYRFPNELKNYIIKKLQEKGYEVKYEYKKSEIVWKNNNCFICALLDGCKLKKISKKSKIDIFNQRQREQKQLQLAIEMMSKQLNLPHQQEQQINNRHISAKSIKQQVLNNLNNHIMMRINAFNILDFNGLVDNFIFLDKINNQYYKVNSDYILNFYNRNKNGNGLANQQKRINAYSKKTILNNIRECLNNFYYLCNQVQYGQNPPARYSKFVNLFIYAYNIHRNLQLDQRSKESNVKFIATVFDVHPTFIKRLFQYFDNIKQNSSIFFGVNYDYGNIIKDIIGVCVDHHNDMLMFKIPNNFASKPMVFNKNIPKVSVNNGNFIAIPKRTNNILSNDLVNGNNKQNIINNKHNGIFFLASKRMQQLKNSKKEEIVSSKKILLSIILMLVFNAVIFFEY